MNKAVAPQSLAFRAHLPKRPWMVAVVSDARLATSDAKSKQDLEPQAAKHKGSGNGTSLQQRWQKKAAASAC